jgi:hypothetical protein
MTITSKLFISLSVLVAASATSAWGQIDFRRPSGMKDRVVTQPAKETAQPPIRHAPNAEETNNSLAAGLRDFIVEPDENSAVIKFKAPAGSAPTVEIGVDRPIAGPGGKLEFPSRVGLVKAEIVTDENALQQINFKAELTGLDRGQHYYYIVSTSNANLQTQGRFSTVRRQASVTVVFTDITVIRGEAGIFDFWVGGSHLGWIGSTDKMLGWESDSGSHAIEKSLEIADAPDSLEILVNVCTDTSYFFENNGCAGLHAVGTKKPYKNSSSETNAALRIVNIRELTGANVKRDFELESIQSGDVEVAFKVRGYVVITRQ